MVEEYNGYDNGYNYELRVNDWENYGKSRTYFKIVETRDHSKHYTEYDYGYFDNQSESYVAGRLDINKYNLSGNAIDPIDFTEVPEDDNEPEEIETFENTKKQEEQAQNIIETAEKIMKNAEEFKPDFEQMEALKAMNMVMLENMKKESAENLIDDFSDGLIVNEHVMRNYGAMLHKMFAAEREHGRDYRAGGNVLP